MAYSCGIPSEQGRPGLTEALLSRIKSESFEDGKLTGVSQTLSMGPWAKISCASVRDLLGNFPFKKIAFITAMAPHIHDIPTGSSSILHALSFSSDKEEAGKVLTMAHQQQQHQQHQPPPSFRPQPAPSVSEGRTGLSEALHERLKGQAFDDGRISTITQVLSMGPWLPIPCSEIKDVVQGCPFKKMEAIRLLAPHLSDIPTATSSLLHSLSFPAEKEEAGKILAAAFAKQQQAAAAAAAAVSNPSTYPYPPPQQACYPFPPQYPHYPQYPPTPFPGPPSAYPQYPPNPAYPGPPSAYPYPHQQSYPYPPPPPQPPYPPPHPQFPYPQAQALPPQQPYPYPFQPQGGV